MEEIGRLDFTRLAGGALLAVVVLFSAPTVPLVADTIEQAVDSEELAYRAAILQRSARIVEQLQLSDTDQKARVTQLVADQYRGLRNVHGMRDEELANLGTDESDSSRKRQEVIARVESATITLHRLFIAQLSAELSLEKVEQVKDGMTYGVVTGTYNAYLELLPDLPDDLKRMIKANLIEAREYAMDAGSSDRKHAWFGKYKGRINNTLSAAGYDLKQAEKELALRRKNAQPTEAVNE